MTSRGIVHLFQNEHIIAFYVLAHARGELRERNTKCSRVRKTLGIYG